MVKGIFQNRLISDMIRNVPVGPARNTRISYISEFMAGTNISLPGNQKIEGTDCVICFTNEIIPNIPSWSLKHLVNEQPMVAR